MSDQDSGGSGQGGGRRRDDEHTRPIPREPVIKQKIPSSRDMTMDLELGDLEVIADEGDLEVKGEPTRPIQVQKSPPSTTPPPSVAPPPPSTAPPPPSVAPPPPSTAPPPPTTTPIPAPAPFAAPSPIETPEFDIPVPPAPLGAPEQSGAPNPFGPLEDDLDDEELSFSLIGRIRSRLGLRRSSAPPPPDDPDDPDEPASFTAKLRSTFRRLLGRPDF